MNMDILFVETSVFSRQREILLPGDDDFRELQLHLLANPTAGVVIPGLGGLRKARWSRGKVQSGKRGGLRIIYAWFPANSIVFLFAVYAKNRLDELSHDQKKKLGELYSRLEKDLTGR